MPADPQCAYSYKYSIPYPAENGNDKSFDHSVNFARQGFTFCLLSGRMQVRKK